MTLDIHWDEIKKIKKENLEDLVTELKGDILTLIHNAESGHCGGSLSLVRPLLLYYWSCKENIDPHLSKGHCVPTLYAIGHKFGNITKEEMARFRTIGGLSGHADKRVQPIPSGILGQGCGIANGMARFSKKRIYSFHGDGELDEPAMWGSIIRAGEDNLGICYVIDHNGKNLTGTLKGNFKNKLDAMQKLGISVIHSKNTVDDLISSYYSTKANLEPTAIAVDSIKGEGISFMEKHESGWHGDPLTDELYEQAMDELGLKPKTFKDKKQIHLSFKNNRLDKAIEELKSKGLGLEKKATRTANEHIAELGDKFKNLIVLTPDIYKSVKMEKFKEKFPGRFFDVGIDEMEATLEAIGMAAGRYKPIVSTFDAFVPIFFSAIRTADYGNLPVGFIMTHAEFIGEDGPTHMATENLGMFKGLNNIETIANPADIYQAKQAIDYSIRKGGMFYIRLGRPKVPTIYTKETLPNPGQADALMKGNGPTIITTGQEVWESLIAAEMLKKYGFKPTVVNVAYFKPFDAETVCKASEGKKIFTIEAHNPETGLGSLVAYHLAKNNISHKGLVPLGITNYVPSGSIESQKSHCRLSGNQICHKIKNILHST